MELNIRPLLETDYDNILVGWWEGWKWTPPAKDILPENGKGGFIVYYGATPVCAGFAYATNSKVGWVEWVVSNPKFKDKDVRKEAIIMLISSLTQTLRQSGYEYAYTIVKNESLMSHYESIGYVKGSTRFTELIKKL